MSWREGRETPTIFSAALTIRWRDLKGLDGASVESAHDGGRGSGSSEFAEEVETLLCFLGQCCSVVSPGEVLCDVHTQELGAARSLRSRTVDGQRSMLSVHSPEVNNNLLRLLHIQREIVVPAPPSQAAHLAPVVCLISVANETHHSRVIRKLNEKVRVVWRCAVVGQQSEEEMAQHTSLGGTCVQCDGAGCVNADPYCLRSSGQKVQQPVAQRDVEESLLKSWGFDARRKTLFQTEKQSREFSAEKHLSNVFCLLLK